MIVGTSSRVDTKIVGSAETSARRGGRAARALERTKHTLERSKSTSILLRWLNLLPSRINAMGHVETVIPSLFRKGPRVEYRRECLIADADGGHVTLDWLNDDTVSDKPLCVVLPGLAGGSADSYIRSFVVSAHERGYDPVVFNSRGCASSSVTTPQFYSACYTEDVRTVMSHLRERFGKRKVYAVGWSLGANILVNYLAEEGEKCDITCSASVANPWDLKKCCESLPSLYDRKLANSLTANLNNNLSIFRGNDSKRRKLDVDKALEAKRVQDFDKHITAPTFGYSDVTHYYTTASSSQRLDLVEVPLLCVNAANDPISKKSAIPNLSPSKDNIAFIVTREGGHIGWNEAGEGLFGLESSFISDVVLDFWSDFD